ncbi:probable disease resistance RPP8-like protein 2 [Camellia sinensis]|uniref:probable disease resistance RPP8-like protein 2 n=1 Tax=Camellia sinensis TaxID=4442 RepID=UPI001035C180|nr:probable disease resistance RPP8-like protein 2 [Camellia sinensis]
MIELGKAIVKHYGGVPLAIMVLGGLSTTKNKLLEWKKVSKNISYDLSKGKSQGGIPITDILALSYQDLPYHLKVCFLYLSHLPEDCVIRAKKLIQMLMVEGIVLASSIPTRVGEVEEETILDVGMSYLGELVQRCMFQVQLTRFNKRIKLCRLHVLMRDLCMLKAKEENFLEIVHIKGFGHQLTWVDPAPPSSSSSLTTIRRVVVYYLSDRDANSMESGNVIALSGHEMKNHHHNRSCQFYSFGNELESSGWQKLKLLFKGLTLITVLDLERITISAKGKKFPRAIGNLIYLRYLSIRESNTITSLSSSIGNLGFLQTLDLRRWSISSLRIPNVLWRLKQLRPLYLPSQIKLAGTNKLQLDSLNKLETLAYFDTKYCDVRCLSKLTNLRKFSGQVAPKDLVVMLKSLILNNSNCLLRYSSFWISGDFQTFEEQSLLRGRPNANIGEVAQLKESHLSLEFLHWEGDGLFFCTNNTIQQQQRFSSAQILLLESIRNLEEWKVEQGAMPYLFRLVIVDCPKLNEIPNRLRFITNLHELQIQRVSEALRDRLREGGEDFYKVHHVPSVAIP